MNQKVLDLPEKEHHLKELNFELQSLETLFKFEMKNLKNQNVYIKRGNTYFLETVQNAKKEKEVEEKKLKSERDALVTEVKQLSSEFRRIKESL